MDAVEWVDALPALAAGLGVLIVPGAAVVVCGWGLSLKRLLAAPALSIAIAAVGATLAGAAGVAWNALTLAAFSLILMGVAYGVRRYVRASGDAGVPQHAPVAARAAALVGLALGATVIGWHVSQGLMGPGVFSFTYDDTVHLNAVRWAMEHHDASPWFIGSVSKIGFYPNGWHSVASVIGLAASVQPIVAINVTNLLIAALVWPASMLALVWTLLRRRPAALVAGGVLAGAFVGVPYSFLFFGTLYPNLTGYAMVPAAVASALWVGEASGPRDRLRALVLAVGLAGGTGLAHPNAFLVVVAFVAFIVVARLWTDVVRGRSSMSTRRAWFITGAIAAAGGVLWLATRTHWDWPSWGGPARELWEGLAAAPYRMPVSIALLVLLVIGYASVGRVREAPALIAPFAAALVLFVVGAGFASENILRNIIADPFYNDPWRLFAILSISQVPIAVVGAVTVWDLGLRLLARVPRGREALTRIVVVAGVGALVLVANGPTVAAGVSSMQSVRTPPATGGYVTADELALMERLDRTTDSDALLIGDPQTGTAFAYGISGRHVVEMHILGDLTADEQYLSQHLGQIDSDPRVCQAVTAVGVSYALDFGAVRLDFDLGTDKTYPGLHDLTPGEHLQLVDQEGPDARLFRIVGCDARAAA
ncbi:DUF6541 family protein [Demequina capsici]|uniref:DUF6541 family protein n=1 Tax=Demequina capsici TaxID=3075620 RepID=A0AA96JAI7_9MICO|nr:DUF6541 family protein [Demequina sp. OYTSA14]WNM24736.1 DUF6541 family protein [Demequina sp. OYTSA14]